MRNSYALDTTWRTVLPDLGVRPADVLRRAGLPEDLFAQPSARLEPADYYRLWNSIEAEVGAAALPIRLCEVFRAESFSPPLFAALCSPDFLVGVQRIGRYKALIGPMRLTVSDNGFRVVIQLSWPDITPQPPTSLVMLELLFFVTLARLGTRQPVHPVEVTTTDLPESLRQYEDFLAAPLRRGPAHQLVFTTADATLPFLTSNDPLWTVFEPELRRRLADLEVAASTTERVRAALLEALPSGSASIDAIARKLALSKRTLQRRIEAESTSFQHILDTTRHHLATHYLEHTTLSIAEISFLLGFTEPNSFYRAFRAWTGTTPDRLRRAPASWQGHARSSHQG